MKIISRQGYEACFIMSYCRSLNQNIVKGDGDDP